MHLRILRYIITSLFFISSSLPAWSQSIHDDHKIKYNNNLLSIKGKEQFVYCGSFHYFRCVPELWRNRLEKIKAAGFNCITTPVPWNYHEPFENRIHFEELEDFLNLCEELGLNVIVKTGPYIDSGWDSGGFPAWLTVKGVRLRSNDPDYMVYARRWYAAVLRALREHLVTLGGCIILIYIEDDKYTGAQYKNEAIRNLYQMIEEMDINVPIITNWGHDVRGKSGFNISPIRKAGDLHHSWDQDGVQKIFRTNQVVNHSSPAMPVWIETGLCAGENGEPPQFNFQNQADRLNVLTKTCILKGTGLINLYMLYGGTNFGYNQGWSHATSNDRFAPIREWGELSQTYYTAKLIGNWLEQFGTSVAKSNLIINTSYLVNPDTSPIYKPLVEWKFFLPKTVDWRGPELQYNFDDTSWETVRIGADFEHCLDDFAGYAYYRTSVYVDKRLYSYPEIYLNFLGAGDNVYVFVNGKLAGKRYRGDETFVLNIKEQLTAGHSSIAVVTEAVKTSRDERLTPKGIYKPVILSPQPVHQPVIEISEKVYKNQAFLFLFNTSSEKQAFSFTYWDPVTRTHRTIPKQKQKVLEAGDMQILVCNIPIGSVLLKYCTSQILGITKQDDTYQVIVHGENGHDGEAAFQLSEKPKFFGTSNFSWYGQTKQLVIYFKHEKEPQTIQIGNVSFIILDTYQAERTWIVPSAEETSYPIITDSYFLRNAAVTENRLTANLEDRPGTCHPVIYGLPESKWVRVNGKKIPFLYNKKTLKTAFEFQVPEYSFKEISFTEAKFHREDFYDLTRSEKITLQPIEYLGDFENGYKVYYTTFPYIPADSVIIELRALKKSRTYPRHYPSRSIPPPEKQYADPKMVLLNGQYVPGASTEFAVSAGEISYLLQKGENSLAIILESLGQNGHEEAGGDFERLKGVVRVYFKKGNYIVQDLKEWYYKNSLDGQGARYYDPDFKQFAWKTTSLGNWKTGDKQVKEYNGIVWYRINFKLDVSEEWSVPLMLSLKARTSALIYVNGKLLGSYRDSAPQQDFYLPESWLNLDGKNNITIAVQNSGGEGGLYKAVIKPYKNACVRRQKVEIKF